MKSKALPVSVVGGLGLATYSLYHYYNSGYSAAGFMFWLLSIILLAGIFFLYDLPSRPFGRFSRKDLLIALTLTIFISPLYVAWITDIPFQIGSDEVVVMVAERMYQQSLSFNFFDLDFHFPRLNFLLYTFIGDVLGRIDLTTMRLVHTLTGLAVVPAAYYLFRRIGDRGVAAVAAIFLGVNHAHIMISRQAAWNNAPALIVAIALTFLLSGLRRRSLALTFVGGLALGLTFHLYFPARVGPFIFFFFVLAVLVGLRFAYSLRFLTAYTAVTALGFSLVATPIVISTIKTPTTALFYPRQQILLFNEGRELQRGWIAAPSQAAGIRENIISGLTMFNTRQEDLGFIYWNTGHGFLDPLTGALLWLGVLTVALLLWRRSVQVEGNLLMLVGFFVTWATFTFLTTKNPNYGRLLVILPFVAYFAAWGSRAVADALAWISKRLWPRAPSGTIRVVILGAVMCGVVGLNLVMMRDFMNSDFNRGHTLGATARYVMRVAQRPYSFYLITSSAYPYFEWGTEAQWREHWLGFFAEPDQTVAVLTPEDHISKLGNPPFTAFMTHDLWLTSADAWQQRYPEHTVQRLTPRGNILAIDVTR